MERTILWKKISRFRIRKKHVMNLLFVEEVYDEIFDGLEPKNVTTTDEGDWFLLSTKIRI